MTPKQLICVLGPTAIGKTSLAIQLANHYATEILSADSRQFYKEMNIGTAVPSAQELTSAKHHFIQHLSIHDPYSVGKFEKEAEEKLLSLFKLHNQVILVGGSGLYVKAVTQGLDEFPTVNEATRTKLNNELLEKGLAHLQLELKTVDPHAYQQMDMENPMRVIRALSVYRASGLRYSSFLAKNLKTKNFISIKIVLTAPREIIYQRIEERVDAMIAKGLVEEVKQLSAYRNLNALNTVGYKEIVEYLDGNSTLPKAIEEIKKNTRRFAKRQLTWFRNQENAIWIDYQTPFSGIIELIENYKHRP